MAMTRIKQLRGERIYIGKVALQALPSLGEIEEVIKFIPRLPTAHCAASIAIMDLFEDATDSDPCLLMMDSEGSMGLIGPLSSVDELPRGYSLVASIGPKTDVERITTRIMLADAARQFSCRDAQALPER